MVGALIARGVAGLREWRKDPSRHLRRALGDQRDIAVVQIGASDGERQDPIRKLLLEHPGWTSLMVEPYPPSYQQLRANYPDEPRFTIVNAGVTADDGEMPFWYIHPDARASVPWLADHVDQLGTFHRDNLVEEMGRNRVHELGEHFTSMPVPTLRLRTLLDRHEIERIDLLIVDTNGYDWVVLEQLDLERYRPKVVLFEHKHLSAADRQRALARLEGYRVTDIGDDYLCVRDA